MSAGSTAPRPAPDRTRPRSPWIGGPVYDSVFFVFAPILTMALAGGFWTAGLTRETGGVPLASLYLNTFLIGHLLLTFVRTHTNGQIFRSFPYRFTVVPAGVYLALTAIPTFRALMAVVLNLWGYWHAWQQTFGLARIYDAKVGNPPKAGRSLDFWLNVVLWMGPLLGGVRFLGEARLLGEDLAPLSPGLHQSIPALAALYAPWFTGFSVIGGVGFVGWYLYRYQQLRREGYRVARNKIALLVCTALAQIVGWGLDPLHQGRFMTLVFHYWQYFAIMWVMEGSHLTRTLRLDGVRGGRWATLAVFLAIPLGGGLLLSLFPPQAGPALSAMMLLSFLHFWYDGFVWSVRKKMV